MTHNGRGLAMGWNSDSSAENKSKIEKLKMMKIQKADNCSFAGTTVDSGQVFKTRRSAKPIAKPNVSSCSFQKQTYPFGCGLYAVANALDLKNFITEERLEVSQKGINNGQLSNFLQEDGNDLFIDVLYCDTYQNKLPEEWTELIISGDNTYMPLLIQCEVNEKYHLIAAKLFQNKEVELIDSLKHERIKCSLSDVNKMYEKVVGLYSFNHLETCDYVFF